MAPPRKRLGEILVQAGVLSDAQLRAALTEQKRWGGPLGRILIDMKLITEDAMVQALSHQLNFPAVNLDQRTIENNVVDLVPAELAEQHSVVPFNVQGKFLDVAMSDPTNLGIIDELRIRTRLNVRPYLAGPKSIERALAKYYGRGIATINFTQGDSADTQMAMASRQPEVARQTGPWPSATPTPVGPPPLAGEPLGANLAARRAATGPEPAVAAAREAERVREIAALQDRVAHLEALVARDEDVLRKLLSLFVEKGLATRDEILERIK